MGDDGKKTPTIDDKSPMKRRQSQRKSIVDVKPEKRKSILDYKTDRNSLLEVEEERKRLL